LELFLLFLFECADHILSTAGDALKESAFWQKPLSQQAIVGFLMYRVMPKEQGIPEIRACFPHVADEGGLLF
jgi:hypothetical protein